MSSVHGGTDGNVLGANDEYTSDGVEDGLLLVADGWLYYGLLNGAEGVLLTFGTVEGMDDGLLLSVDNRSFNNGMDMI